MWDERLAPDGYGLYWMCFPSEAEHVPRMHAHLHVVPRFADEPRAEGGGRVGIKGADNIRPDPTAPGRGLAKLFGRWLATVAIIATVLAGCGGAVAETKVPVVVHETQGHAAQRLFAEGLCVRFRYARSVPADLGLVVRQVPPAGTPIRRGASVTLIVGHGQPSSGGGRLSVTSVGLEIPKRCPDPSLP